MSWKDWFKPVGVYRWFHNKFMATQLGDGDAVVLVPYEDGVLVPKRGYFSKQLVGNQAGYHTDDGDIFVSDGAGDPIKWFGGVPVVLAINPSVHAGIIEPMKSLIAQKRNIGEFVRVDRKGNTVEHGEAIEPIQEVTADGGEVAAKNPNAVNWEVHEGVFDLSPPILEDPETGEKTQADGFIIDQSKAADLIPAKTSSGELALMQQRERNAAMEKKEMLKYLFLGAVGSSIMWLLFILILGVATGSMPSVV